jgi:hypothetical protein
MTTWRDFILAVLTLVTAGLAIAYYARYSITVVTLWWIAAGVMILWVTFLRRTRRARLLAAVALAAVFAALSLKYLPIWSLGWGRVDRLEIAPVTREWTLTVDDQRELDRFAAFGRRGHWAEMMKSGYGFEVNVIQEGKVDHYFIHGDALGTRPGGHGQTIFVPAQPGFTDYFEDLLRRKGRDREGRGTTESGAELPVAAERAQRVCSMHLTAAARAR